MSSPATCGWSARCRSGPAASPSSSRSASSPSTRCSAAPTGSKRSRCAENLKHTAAFRLALGKTITNLQASWVKMGLEGATEALRWGVNDLGGTLMEENISRMAGSQHGVRLEPEQLIAAARAAGREPAQRTTLYEIVETYVTDARRWSWSSRAPAAASWSSCRSPEPGAGAGAELAVHACGVCRTDLHIVDGELPGEPKLPLVPGPPDRRHGGRAGGGGGALRARRAGRGALARPGPTAPAATAAAAARTSATTAASPATTSTAATPS